jgi:hypothetical protein
MPNPTAPIKPPNTWDSGQDATTTLTLDPTLPPGTYTFSLVVEDDAGLLSAPATWAVQLRSLPVAKIAGPQAVAEGQPINLNGQASTASAGGKITKYTWTVKAPGG